MKTFTKEETVTLVVGLVIIIGLISILVAQKKPESSSSLSTLATTTETMNNSEATTTASQGKNISTDPRVQIIEVKSGTGAEAKQGSHVYVHYIGTLTNGTKFDSSYDRGEPINFTLGAGQVIKGWDVGLLGMKVGGKRHLVIQPEFAYGAKATGPIPANSTLVFDVELVDVK